MDQTNIRQRRPQQTEKIRGLQCHTQMYGKTEKKKKSYCGEKSVHGSREHLSICPVSQYYHVIFSFSDVFNQHGPIFFSPQGVSFESFSSISRTRLYSNAITQVIKGTSIICIAQLFPFKALKDCNLKQTIDITDMEEYTPGIYYCDEKFLRQLSEESIHLRFTLAAALCGYRLLDGWCHVK